MAIMALYIMGLNSNRACHNGGERLKCKFCAGKPLFKWIDCLNLKGQKKYL